MARFAVTGGAGLIGSHLVRKLLGLGHHVVVLDNLSTGREENLPPGAEFIRCDVSRPQDLERLPDRGIEGVFHLAAQSSGEISFENPYADFQINAGGTLLLLDWCRRNRVERFVYTSSMAAYGINSAEPIAEDAPCRPLSFYGVGKLASENYVRLYASMGMKTTIFRPFNVYGPMQNMDNMKQGMASIYMSFLLKGEPIVVKGSLERFRDQVFVTDVVEAMTSCIEKPVSVGQTYNLGAGRMITVKELIDTMIKVSGRKPREYPVKVSGSTPGDLFGCFANASKARAELGWTPRYDLEAGLREMYNHCVGKGR